MVIPKILSNYDYFEKDFDYDEVLKLPSKPSQPTEPQDEPPNIDEAVSTILDPLAELKEIIISDEGMKIDRNLFRSFRNRVTEDEFIKELVSKHEFDEAEKYLNNKVLDVPQEFFTLDKLRKSLGIDRRLTVSELLLHAFGHIEHIPSQRECLDEEFDKLDKALQPDDAVYSNAKEVFEAYAVDNEFRDIIDSRRYAELSVHPSGETFKKLPRELKQSIPLYIKDNVNLDRLENVG